MLSSEDLMNASGTKGMDTSKYSYQILSFQTFKSKFTYLTTINYSIVPVKREGFNELDKLYNSISITINTVVFVMITQRTSC